MSTLFELHLAIDARVEAIRMDRPDWLCGKGCDGCCRQLAEVPRLTSAEWELLRAGLAALPAQQLGQIRRELGKLGKPATAPALPGECARRVVCPLLDRTSGACPVYAQRPVACRSYGFYVQRDLGLYCAAIESRVADGALADVVWGNHDAIDQRLAGLGEVRSLSEWFACWPDEQ